MTETSFPYTAYVLTPSLVPKAAKFVSGHENTWMSRSYHKRDSGSYINVADIYPTRAEAIEAAQKKLEAMEADLAKRQERLIKKREALNKAIAKG